ncbi:hypothetical protein KEJ50_04760 [Candidatus Bathyarchaeota archaeon]|nr:hypothetical protein [Candidatus Bathyarchaeota archaeon]
MPYIPQEERRRYESSINELVLKLPKEDEKIDGHLNYIITKILKSIYKQRYFDYNRAIGVLECVKQEYYRVMVAAYEDEKRRETGDI